MLSIGKLGKGQERYYTEKVAEGAEDYYSGEGEAEGQWIGDAAADLGLEGPVAPAQLTAMLTGNDPATGEPLGLRAVGGSGPVPGFDLTFSAPKSVSLAWGLGGPEVGAQVAAAHERSVQAALGYLQRHACWTRRGAGGAEFVQGSGYLGVAYRHRSSRNGDPQLHTHVLIANATKGPDGKWSRLYHPAIYEHAKTASYLYEAQLRHELSLNLGVRWQEVRKGIAEIEGFEDRWLREFSTRRREILEAAGPDASAKARQVAALATRRAKEQELTIETLHERWRTRATEIGFGREQIVAVLGQEGELKAQLTLAQLDRQVTAHASHFERRDAIQAVAELLPNGAPAADVEAIADAFLASAEVRQITETPRAARYTTERIWQLEREALDTAQRMASEPRGVAGEPIAARVLKARPTLKPDQREMVERLLAGHEGIAIVIGEAGTGKSFAIVAAAEGWAQAGFELQVATPTWRAANVLKGDGLEATTIARLLIDIERGKVELSEHSVFLVDEAAMVGSEDLASLIRHAQEAEAKLVLVGDPEQLGSVEAGGLFSALADRTEPIGLHEVIRHEHEVDREAASRIREGQGRDALDLYRSAERVTVAPDAERRREAMVSDWWHSYELGDDSLMVAKTNAEVARLNATAREVMQAEGRLGDTEIEVGGARFAAGDQVITRVNDQSQAIYNRERWRIAEVDVQKEQVTLEGIDRARRVEIGREYLDQTTLNGEAAALQHAYAVTTYCAQGTTVDRAYVAADPSMDKQELYVAASRSREETYLYATPEIPGGRSEFAPEGVEQGDALDHIAAASVRDRAQTAAHDEALRAELGALPSAELTQRRGEIATPARFEAEHEHKYAYQAREAENRKEQYAQAIERREAVEDLGWRERRQKLPYAREAEQLLSERLAENVKRLESMEPPTDALRRERDAIDRLLGEREERMLTAIRLQPPEYITKELGERPGEPGKAKAWDRGVKTIEGYRQEHGIADPTRALGSRPSLGLERSSHDDALRRLREAQQRLQLTRQLQQTLERRQHIEMDFGIGGR
jgi:conjugative relaxase-like TrwC/TraI family protein